MLTMILSAFVIVSGTALAPLGPAQQARLAALLVWADAYRTCYQRAPYGLAIDKSFTSDCIQRSLGRASTLGPPEEQAAIASLIGQTPHLVAALNAPGTAAAPHEPAPPPQH